MPELNSHRPRPAVIEEMICGVTPSLQRMFAKNGVADYHDRADMSQEVLVKVLERFDAPEFAQINPRGYLWAAGRNKLRERWRKKGTESGHLEALYSNQADAAHDDSVGIDAGMRRENRLALINRIKADLGPRRFEALILTQVEGLSHEEAAKRMGCTLVASQKRVSNCRPVLAKFEDLYDQGRKTGHLAGGRLAGFFCGAQGEAHLPVVWGKNLCVSRDGHLRGLLAVSWQGRVPDGQPWAFVHAVTGAGDLLIESGPFQLPLAGSGGRTVFDLDVDIGVGEYCEGRESRPWSAENTELHVIGV